MTSVLLHQHPGAHIMIPGRGCRSAGAGDHVLLRGSAMVPVVSTHRAVAHLPGTRHPCPARVATSVGACRRLPDMSAPVLSRALMPSAMSSKRRDADGDVTNFCAAFKDDLIYWSDSYEEHVEQTERLVAALSFEGIKLNASKVHMFCSYVRYLGCIVGNEELHMDPQKVRVRVCWESLVCSL